MKLTFVQRIFIHLTFSLLFLSGAAWLLLKYIFDLDYSFNFLAVWSLRLHGFMAFGFLIVFGMIFSTHVAFNWKIKKNHRISGIILMVFFVLLIISGYFLYYAGNEDFRHLVSYLHQFLGIFCLAIFLFHIFRKAKNVNTR